jgi:hypothetical protein
VPVPKLGLGSSGGWFGWNFPSVFSKILVVRQVVNVHVVIFFKNQ